MTTSTGDRDTPPTAPADDPRGDGSSAENNSSGGPSAPVDAKGTKEAASCTDRRSAWVAAGFGIMAILMALATVVGEFLGGRGSDATDASEQASEGGLAGLLLFGVLTFFFAMGSLIALFRALGLTNEAAALGMPYGSVRAFMALVLIMLFFLMAVFLYLDIARTGAERSVVGVSQEAYDQLLAGGQVIAANVSADTDPEDPGGAQKWDVILRSTRERSQVAEDLARQLVTVLGTLIVAIAAFYFGSNSVGQAQRETEERRRELVKLEVEAAKVEQALKDSELKAADSPTSVAVGATPGQLATPQDDDTG